MDPAGSGFGVKQATTSKAAPFSMGTPGGKVELPHYVLKEGEPLPKLASRMTGKGKYASKEDRAVRKAAATMKHTAVRPIF